MDNAIINKVAESSLITIDLEDFFPKEEVLIFDMKDHLFMGLILKEKDFRAALTNLNWERYQNKLVALTCTADAIIPVWAYMLVAAYLEPIAKEVVFGNEQELINAIMAKNINSINTNEYTDKRLVIKGCGDIKIPDAAYVHITHKLKPVVKSIMYGEPCSTVPVYKKK